MRKRILMITGLGSAKDLASDKKGAFFHTLEELHQYWERIDVIAPRIKNVNSGEKILFNNVHIHISSWPLWFHPIFFIKKGLEINRKFGFDLMTVQDFPPFYNGIGACLLSFLTGRPYVLEIMHIPGVPKAASFKEIIYKIFTALFIAIDALPALRVRVINKKQTPGFLRQYGVPLSKIAYVPAFYIDKKVFKPLDAPKKFDLVYAARLEKNKGIISLIEALEILKNKGKNFTLLIIGSGPLEVNLKKYIDKKNLGDYIKFSGWLPSAEEVAQAYNSAKVFINPALNEGGPRVALEAMACGIPIITTRVGIMLDVIENKVTGLFSGWSPLELSESIEVMFDDLDLEKRLSHSGPEVVSQFERATSIKNYSDFLHNL